MRPDVQREALILALARAAGGFQRTWSSSRTRLPDGCREAFVLHDIEGFDHKEVGDLLGIAEGTSKSQVFKARAKLRALLGTSR